MFACSSVVFVILVYGLPDSGLVCCFLGWGAQTLVGFGLLYSGSGLGFGFVVSGFWFGFRGLVGLCVFGLGF